MFCPNCGMENPDNSAACRRCRVPLQEDVHPEAHAEGHAEAHAEAAPGEPAGHGEANDAGTLCSRCETFNEPGIQRCTTCGYPLAAAGAAPPAHHEETPAEHDLQLEQHHGEQHHGEPHHEEAPHEEHLAAHEPEQHHEHDEEGHTHALEPVLTHDTPAEGSPSIADELSALELSPEDARAARGEDATPPDGSPPVLVNTQEHKLDIAHEPQGFGEEDEDRTSVSPEPTFSAPFAARPGAARTATPPAASAPPVSAAPVAARRAPSAAPVATPPPPVKTPPAPVLAPASKASPAPAVSLDMKTPAEPVRVPVAASAPPPVAAEKICASCGSTNFPNAKFCAECGTPFAKASAPTAPPPAAPAPTPPPPVAPAREEAHDEPVQGHAESLHDAMHAALAEHEAAEKKKVVRPSRAYGEDPNPEPVDEDDRIPEARHEEPVHEEPQHEEPVHEELQHEEPAAEGELEEKTQGAFDPQKTDQGLAADEDAESTSEQVRVPVALEEAPEHAHGDADDAGGVAPLSFEHEAQAQESQEPQEPEAGMSVSVESVQPLEDYPVEEQPEHGHVDAPFDQVAMEPAAYEEASPEAEALAAPLEDALPEETPAEAVEAPQELAQDQGEAPQESSEGAEQPAEQALEQVPEQSYDEPAAEALEPQPPPYQVLLVVEQGEHAGTTFHLAAQENSIGGLGAAIELTDDAHLAPHHATMLFEDQRLLLRDEGSANGVYLKLRVAAALEPGDQFIAGERLLRFDGPVELGSSASELPFQGAPRPPGTAVRVVELLAGGKQGRTCHRAGPVIAVGKSGCDLNFGADTLLAPRHAEIHLAEDGSASLIDLGAVPAGVLVRVRQGQTVELQSGDVLQLGGQTLRVEVEQQG